MLSFFTHQHEPVLCQSHSLSVTLKSLVQLQKLDSSRCMIITNFLYVKTLYTSTHCHNPGFRKNVHILVFRINSVTASNVAEKRSILDYENNIHVMGKSHYFDTT